MLIVSVCHLVFGMGEFAGFLLLLLNAVIIGYAVVVGARTMGFLTILILDYCLWKCDFENIVIVI